MLNWKCSCYENEMAVLVSWPKSSLHILSSPLRMISTNNVKRHCIDLHHNYILQAFVLEMVICTSYFFINNFPSFLKAKIAFEIGLLLRFCSLGFGLNTLRCSLPLEHSAQHFPSLVLGK